jgi:hypothetical protein
MVYQSTIAAFAATLLVTQTLAIAVPSVPAEELVSRGTPNLSPNTASCFNTWETVTNDVSTVLFIIRSFDILPYRSG